MEEMKFKKFKGTSKNHTLKTIIPYIVYVETMIYSIIIFL